MTMRDREARESSWIALRSDQIGELPSAEKRGPTWPGAGIAVGTAIVAMTTMVQILYYVYQVLGWMVTDTSLGSAGVPVLALLSAGVGAVLIVTGVVSRLVRGRRRRRVLDAQPVPQVNNRHAGDLAGMR